MDNLAVKTVDGADVALQKVADVVAPNEKEIAILASELAKLGFEIAGGTSPDASGRPVIILRNKETGELSHYVLTR